MHWVLEHRKVMLGFTGSAVSSIYVHQKIYESEKVQITVCYDQVLNLNRVQLIGEYSFCMEKVKCKSFLRTKRTITSAPDSVC